MRKATEQEKRDFEYELKQEQEQEFEESTLFQEQEQELSDTTQALIGDNNSDSFTEEYLNQGFSKTTDKTIIGSRLYRKIQNKAIIELATKRYMLKSSNQNIDNKTYISNNDNTKIDIATEVLQKSNRKSYATGDIYREVLGDDWLKSQKQKKEMMKNG